MDFAKLLVMLLCCFMSFLLGIAAAVRYYEEKQDVEMDVEMLKIEIRLLAKVLQEKAMQDTEEKK